MDHEGDAIDVELPRVVLQEIQVMRLHQLEMGKSIGVASREKDGRFYAFVAREPIKAMLSTTGRTTIDRT